MEINIKGSKNSILPILTIPCLQKGKFTFYNVPTISDINPMIFILNTLNIKTNFVNNVIQIDSCNMKIPNIISFENNIRATYYFFSSLAYTKKIIYHPKFSGCDIGIRSIDLHKDFFKKMGVTIFFNGNNYIVDSTNLKLSHSMTYEFEKKSVGATLNAILLSVIGNGIIKLLNCSIDLYIYELIYVLKLLGASIEINKRTIIIYRKEKLKNHCNYNLQGDPIVSGTAIIFNTLLKKNNVLLNGLNTLWLGEFYQIIKRIGINIEKNNTVLFINQLKSFNIITSPYPGLQTDLMPFLFILGTQIGNCSIQESIFINRFKFAEELKKIGLCYDIENNKVNIKKSVFYFKESEINLTCTDLRGGMAIVLASCLCLQQFPTKKIILNKFDYVKRGYDNIINFIGSFDIQINTISDSCVYLKSALDFKSSVDSNSALDFESNSDFKSSVDSNPTNSHSGSII